VSGLAGRRRWSILGLLSPLLLGVAFFCVLTPVGLVMRLARRDRLRLRFDRQASSYWIERPSTGGRQTSMKKQF
jgi:hypothetical protein